MFSVVRAIDHSKPTPGHPVSPSPAPLPLIPVGISTPTPVPPVAPPKSRQAVEFPLKQARSRDGIISYLTKKHGGNVHDKGIVIITSKSVVMDHPDCAVRNIADLTSNSHFQSKDEPGQWICWDFNEMRVRPTHYTFDSVSLKWWVLEGSLDGQAWTEIGGKPKIDRKSGFMAQFMNAADAIPILQASFPVSNSAECRFIRLTQTSDDSVLMTAFEFFGTLFE
jgi:hypothetical protein